MARLEVKHHMAAEEISAVCEMLDLAADADGHPPLSEHHVLDLTEGDAGGFTAVVAWQEGHPHPVGYAQLIREVGTLRNLQFVVDPHHRGTEPPLEPALIRRAIEAVRSEGGGQVEIWIPKAKPEHDALASLMGMRRRREVRQLRRPLPHAERSSLPVRPFVSGQDELAWLRVNNRTFAGHPEQGGWDMAALAARQSQRWFDPAGLLLHERGGRLAGYCWTKVHRRERPPLGEIYVLGVDPDFQGTGIGRELLLRGLEWLSDRGLATAMLYVDSDNGPALGLYEKLGFSLDHVDHGYLVEVPAGEGLAQPTPPTPSADPRA